MNIEALRLKAERNRKRLMEVICKTGAGHTGGDLSCLNLLTVLYRSKLNIDPEDLSNPDRDRFIMSKGHCAEALFVVLEDKGILPRETLDTLGYFNSPLAGHPTVNVPGIEVSSGALGHGLSIGVGMALAAKMDGRSYMTYVLMGDGEQGEGSILEAAMAANRYHLDNLVAFIDRNGLQISGPTESVMPIEDIRAKWSAFGWEVIDMNGDDIADIVRVLDALSPGGNRPRLIVSHSTKGFGVSYMEGVAKWHHGVPDREQYAEAIAEIDDRIKRWEEGMPC